MVGRIRHCPAAPRGCGRGNGLCPSAGNAVRLSRGIGRGRMAGMAVPPHIFCGLFLRPSQLPVHFWALRCMAVGWQESAWRRVLSMVAYYYNVAPASRFAQSWPARQAVSECNGGRFAMQSGPFGGLKRPVPQCAGGQGVGQVVPFFEIIVTLLRLRMAAVGMSNSGVDSMAAPVLCSAAPRPVGRPAVAVVACGLCGGAAEASKHFHIVLKSLYFFLLTKKISNFARYLKDCMENNKATLELGTKPVGPLLMQYALPAIIAMTASSLYNMVDSIFIGQGVGAMAISGLALTFPFMNLAAAFGAAVGVGASTCISVRLGQKDYEAAERVLGNTVTLNLIIGISFSVISLLFLNPILYFFGASEQTLPYARDYMEVILAGNVFSHMYFAMNAVLRAAGKPRQAMYATMFTVVMNTILAPIFIYPLNLGIRGAAYATIIAQMMALVWQMRLFSSKDELLHLKRGIYRLQGRIVKAIIAIGMSPFAMNVCACVVVIFINNGLQKYGGDLAVGAYGIANKVCFIFVMITMGINQGMQPIAGYNYGAQLMDRLMKVVKYAIIAGTVVTTAGFAIAELLPGPCARLFTTDPTLIALSVEGLMIEMLAFPIVGYQMVVTSFFQSIGKAKVSMFLSLSRQLIFLLPLLAVLPPIYGVDGVWWAMPISDTVAAVVTFFMMMSYMRKFKKMTIK